MKGKTYLALFIVACAVFGWAIIQLFEIRFSRGDVYPAYSTLRTDPLGAKAFYESLAHTDRLDVSRNETALDRFLPPKNSTVFFIGTTDLGAYETEIAKLERFVNGGGRLVVAFYPQSKDTSLIEKPDKQKTSPTPTPSPSPSASPGPEDEPTAKFLSHRDVAKRWELKCQADPALTDGSAQFVNAAIEHDNISWHSALHFKDSGKVWSNVCMARDFPVVIERQMGEGTIVLASDSYFLSNEAMRRERHPGFLAWLIGPNRRVIFDETHLGITESPGVSMLMRRYHLGGLVGGLLVLAALVVWKNSARLLPSPGREAAAEEVVLGKESFAGFVNLLRRNISPSQLLPLSLEQWSRQSLSANQPNAQIERAHRIIKEYPRDIVGAYRQIAGLIHETKWNPHKPN
jgi:hypothetical protein